MRRPGAIEGWRKLNPTEVLDLGGADLTWVNLDRANLERADLVKADLFGSSLVEQRRAELGEQVVVEQASLAIHRPRALAAPWAGYGEAEFFLELARMVVESTSVRDLDAILQDAAHTATQQAFLDPRASLEQSSSPLAAPATRDIAVTTRVPGQMSLF